MKQGLSHAKSRIITALILITLFITACAQAREVAPSAGGSTGNRDNASGAPPAAPQEEGVAQIDQPGKRLVIQNATIVLVVDDPSSSMDSIGQMAQQMGGYIVSSNLRQDAQDDGTKIPHAFITIRVPSERLNEALSAIEALSKDVPLNKQVDSQDVTKDYVDQQSRLRNLEATEAQLNRIMEQATTTEDVLNVYNKLVEIRGQIETTKGQIQYYEQSAAMSAISAELIATEAARPLTIGRWQPVGEARNAIQALIDTVKFLGTAAIWLVILVLPVLLILYFVFFLPLRYLWRRFVRPGLPPRKQPQAPAPPPGD